MVSALFESVYSRPDVALEEKVKKGLSSIPQPWENYPTIELLEAFQGHMPGWTFSLVGDDGQWKYGDVDIKQSWLDGRGYIHVEVGNDFFEKNVDSPRDLIRVLRAILAHEDTHKQQYAKDPTMYIDEDKYYEDEREVDAHAREAAQELLDLNVTEINNDTLMNSSTAFRYWEDFGKDADEFEDAAKIWNRFITELRDYFYEELE